MTRWIWCSKALVASSLALSVPGASAQRYSLDDWSSISAVASFQWGPDGSTIYYTTNDTDSGTNQIFSLDLTSGQSVQLTRASPGVRAEPVQQMVVSSNGETIYFAASRLFQNYTNLYAHPTDGGDTRAITFNDAIIESSPAPSPDGETLAFFTRTSRGTKIFLLDLITKTAWPRLLDASESQERFPVFSPDGTKLAFSRGGDIWIWDFAESKAKRAVEHAYAGGNRAPVFSPDGSRLAFLSSRSGYAQVGLVELENGTLTPITYAAREHRDVAYSSDGTRLVFVEDDASGFSRQIVTHSLEDGSSHALTEGAGIRHSPQFSPDGRFVAFIGSSPTSAPDIWRVSVEGGKPQRLTNSMGSIDETALATPDEVHYPGADGLSIPTMLYRPWNFDPAKRYPVIVRLHGHPGQWNQSFYPEWQYFLERGYVIVAPNPRGSRGFGPGFHDLHIADYGGAEFQDVMHVVDMLKDLPYVDMTKKATWGGSGGGYMSLVIATEAPRAFEAQVIRAPVSSWSVLANDRYAASGRAWTPTRTPRRERSEFGGSSAEIPQEYARRSPLNFVDQVATPQLLFHGLRDSSVLPRQSQLWAERMEELGKADLLDYVEYPDEDHGLKRYKHTVRDRIRRMEKFLATHLGLDAAPSSR